MKKDTLQIGVKGFAVKVDIELPENAADIRKCAKENDAYILGKFIRGYRIDLQEGGARQVIADLVAKDGRPLSRLAEDKEFVAKCQKAALEEIAAFNPDAPRSRGGRPAKPVEINAETAKALAAAKGDAAKMAEILKAQGINVVFTK